MSFFKRARKLTESEKTSYRNEQKELSYQREKKKNKTKNRIVKIIISAILIMALVFGVAFLIRACSNKYSVDNIIISITEKQPNNSYQENDYNFNLIFEVENKGSLAINKLTGNLKIYNTDEECLLSDTLTLNGIVKLGNILQYDVDFNLIQSEKNKEIYDTDLSLLKITYQLTEVEYENAKIKKYKNSDIKVISPISSDSNNNGLKKKVDETLVAFQSADRFDDTYTDRLNVAVDKLNGIWNSIKSKVELLDLLYTDATAYHNNGECEKAYYIFSYLKNAPYKDSAKKAQECYDEAGAVSYDNSKPGKSGIIIEYGSSVSEVESGYDAEDKIFYLDDIVEVDGQILNASDPTNDFYKKLSGKKAGDTVELGIYRKGSFMTITIRLGYKYF